MPQVDAVLSEYATVLVLTEPAELFAFLDDPRRSGMHMSDRSAMMMGGKMDYVLDGAQGRAVGSKIRMTGSIAGIDLSVEEIVTIHDPPWRKAWETVGTPFLS